MGGRRGRRRRRRRERYSGKDKLASEGRQEKEEEEDDEHDQLVRGRKEGNGRGGQETQDWLVTVVWRRRKGGERKLQSLRK